MRRCRACAIRCSSPNLRTPRSSTRWHPCLLGAELNWDEWRQLSPSISGVSSCISARGSLRRSGGGRISRLLRRAQLPAVGHLGRYFSRCWGGSRQWLWRVPGRVGALGIDGPCRCRYRRESRKLHRVVGPDPRRRLAATPWRIWETPPVNGLKQTRISLRSTRAA
jgi:hypothetical protein